MSSLKHMVIGSAIASSTLFVDMLKVKQSKRQNKLKIRKSQKLMVTNQITLFSSCRRFYQEGNRRLGEKEGA